MKKLRVTVFLLLISVVAASIAGTPLSPLYSRSTVSADPIETGSEQDGKTTGRPKPEDCP